MQKKRTWEITEFTPLNLILLSLTHLQHSTHSSSVYLVLELDGVTPTTTKTTTTTTEHSPERLSIIQATTTTTKRSRRIHYSTGIIQGSWTTVICRSVYSSIFRYFPNRSHVESIIREHRNISPSTAIAVSSSVTFRCFPSVHSE